jgi:hypothetical protein
MGRCARKCWSVRWCKTSVACTPSTLHIFAGLPASNSGRSFSMVNILPKGEGRRLSVGPGTHLGTTILFRAAFRSTQADLLGGARATLTGGSCSCPEGRWSCGNAAWLNLSGKCHIKHPTPSKYPSFLGPATHLRLHFLLHFWSWPPIRLQLFNGIRLAAQKVRRPNAGQDKPIGPAFAGADQDL